MGTKRPEFLDLCCAYRGFEPLASLLRRTAGSGSSTHGLRAGIAYNVRIQTCQTFCVTRSSSASLYRSSLYATIAAESTGPAAADRLAAQMPQHTAVHAASAATSDCRATASLYTSGTVRVPAAASPTWSLRSWRCEVEAMARESAQSQ